MLCWHPRNYSLGRASSQMACIYVCRPNRGRGEKIPREIDCAGSLWWSQCAVWQYWLPCPASLPFIAWHSPAVASLLWFVHFFLPFIFYIHESETFNKLQQRLFKEQPHWDEKESFLQCLPKQNWECALEIKEFILEIMNSFVNTTGQLKRPKTLPAWIQQNICTWSGGNVRSVKKWRNPGTNHVDWPF